MPDAMRTEQLPTGQGLAGLTEGTSPQLGASHAENAAMGEVRDLGPGDVEQMFGPATTPLERLREKGRVDESRLEERGGGGDPIENWVAQKGGYDKLLQQIQQNGWGDKLVWKLPDGTQVSVAEVKRRAVEAAAPPPPEAQAAPRPADWRDGLPQDQRKRLEGFENRIVGFSDQELQLVEAGIREARARALKDGWNHRSIQEGDADTCLRAVQEKLVRQDSLQLMLIENGLFDHVKSVQQRVGLKDLQDTLLYLAGKLGYHDGLMENPPPDLFPPAAMMPNGEWDTTGDNLEHFLRKFTNGNKLNNGD